MAVYVEKFGGYIADNPNIEFKRCDGKVFSYDEVNTASMSDSSESLTINGGQSNFPLAIIDTTRTLEFTFDSSEFTMEMFEMANATNAEDADDYTVLESKRYEVLTGLKIEIPYAVAVDTIYINGFEKADAASEGKYTAAAADSKTTITFNTGDVAVGDTVRVAYERPVEGARVVTVKTKSTTAKGELFAHWPVYSSGTDCTEAAVKGYVHLHIFRCRVTALPGFDSSYKSAMTNGVTFTALDPKRAGDEMFELAYEPATED